MPRINGLAGSTAARDRAPGEVIDDVIRDGAAHLARTAIRREGSGQNALRKRRRRGSSTVSAGDAEGPVTVGDVAGGIRRASGCRMIVGSHVNSYLVGLVSDPGVFRAPLGRASHRVERWLSVALDGCNTDNAPVVSKQRWVVCSWILKAGMLSCGCNQSSGLTQMFRKLMGWEWSPCACSLIGASVYALYFGLPI